MRYSLSQGPYQSERRLDANKQIPSREGGNEAQPTSLTTVGTRHSPVEQFLGFRVSESAKQIVPGTGGNFGGLTPRRVLSRKLKSLLTGRSVFIFGQLTHIRGLIERPGRSLKSAQPTALKTFS